MHKFEAVKYTGRATDECYVKQVYTIIQVTSTYCRSSGMTNTLPSSTAHTLPEHKLMESQNG